MIFLQTLLFAFANSSNDLNDIDFPYCLEEYHGSIERNHLLLQELNVGYEFQCQVQCMSHPKCNTFSFATSGDCLLYSSGLYEAYQNLEADLAWKTNSAYRCMFECNRIQNATQCVREIRNSVACKWEDSTCVTSCENFSNENIKAEECGTQSIQCGGALTCSNSSVIGTAETTMYCNGDGACSNLQVSTMATIECNGCVGGYIDSVGSIVAAKLENVNIIAVEEVVCHDCVFDQADILQVSSLRSVAEYGLRSIPANMQAEVQSLECLANNACDNIDVHVNHLTCEGPSSTSSCSASSFTSLGQDSVVLCIGENACAGSAFDGFANVYCIGKGSCENTLILNVGATWCFVENGEHRCNGAVPKENFHQCLVWTGEHCLTAAPSKMPTTPNPTQMPSVHPTAAPTIFIAVEAATRSCQINEWYDMHLTSCFTCPNGMEPTHTKLDCAQCAGNSAGNGGSCDSCTRYMYFPSDDGTKCELNIVIVILIIVSGFACCLSCRVYRRGPSIQKVEVELTKHSKGKKGDASKREPQKKKKRKSIDDKKSSHYSTPKGKDEEKPKKRKSQVKKQEKRKSVEKKRKASEDKPKKRKSFLETNDLEVESDVSRRISPERRKPSLERPGPFRKSSSATARPSLSMNRRKESRGEGESRHSANRVRGWQNWSPSEVGRFFCERNMRAVGDAFETAKVTGQDLKELSYADLCDLGFRDEEITRFDEIMQAYFLSSSL